MSLRAARDYLTEDLLESMRLALLTIDGEVDYYARHRRPCPESDRRLRRVEAAIETLRLGMIDLDRRILS